MKQKGSPRFAPASTKVAVEAGQAPILILVGILIIAAVAGGAYYFGKVSTKSPAPAISTTPQPTSDPATNWKTYTNTVGNYEFKYPQDVKLTEVGYNRGEIVILQVKSNESIQIDIRTKAEFSLDEWLKRHNESSGFEILSSKELLVDDVRAIQTHESAIGMGGGKEEGNFVYMIANGRLFQIANGSSEEVLDKILSTFRFD